MAALTGSRSSSFSPPMARTTEWVFADEPVPADLFVEVGDATFSLHKSLMAEKSDYLRRRLAGEDGAVTVDLSEIPGGAEAFDKVAKFCYGVGFDLTVHDVAAVRCAAEFLGMAGAGVVELADAFLASTALRSLPGAAAVLRSCDGALMPAAEKLGIVRRCVDAIGLKVCNEATFPTRLPPEWWAAELAVLSPAAFELVLRALRSRGADGKIVATAIVVYAETALPDIFSGDAAAGEQVPLLETVVEMLPSEQEVVPIPVNFLCRLLSAAVAAAASPAACRALERRISAVLDQATVADLLSVALTASGEHVGDVEIVRRIIAGFVEREGGGGGMLYGGGAAACSAGMQKVARLVDAFAADIATDEDLTVSKFVAVAGAVPKSARRSDDDLYRAVDIFLKAHPALDEIQREKVCSVMDALKLSYEARVHASQNKRLPLQAALTAIYYDDLKIRSGTATPSPAAAPATQKSKALQADVSLARENAALRNELARMKTYVSELERGGGGMKKGRSLLASVTRTLGKLNPFKSAASKDTASIADAGEAVKAAAKPRRRRFSIS